MPSALSPRPSNGRNFDVVVIGAGPAATSPRFAPRSSGFKTVCIDDWKNAKGKPSLGGTCLNVGCIPSKALLESSENYERALHKFAEHGITVEGVSIDVAKMLARKDKIVDNDHRRHRAPVPQEQGRVACTATAASSAVGEDYRIEVQATATRPKRSRRRT